MSSIKSFNIPVAIAVVLAFAAMAPVHSALAGGSDLKFEAELMAPAAAGDVSGKAKFEDRADRKKFTAEIEGLAPGSSFDVMVAGHVVGTVTIDAAGIGDLNLDSNFEAGVDNPATQFPPNFPVLDGGELITVGQLSGTLQLK